MGNRYRLIGEEIGLRHLDDNSSDQAPVIAYYRCPLAEAKINEQTRFVR